MVDRFGQFFHLHPTLTKSIWIYLVVARGSPNDEGQVAGSTFWALPAAVGIVDQTVLIYAGDAIDNTVGVALGLPTLAAAATQQGRLWGQHRVRLGVAATSVAGK